MEPFLLFLRRILSRLQLLRDFIIIIIIYLSFCRDAHNLHTNLVREKALARS